MSNKPEVKRFYVSHYEISVSKNVGIIKVNLKDTSLKTDKGEFTRIFTLHNGALVFTSNIEIIYFENFKNIATLHFIYNNEEISFELLTNKVSIVVNNQVEDIFEI